MPSNMAWLATVIRITIAPVLIGALAVLVHSPRSSTDVAAAAGLLLLGTVHIVYWWDPWRRRARQAVAALGIMVAINSVLLLGLAEPLLWLYPALVAGAGLRAPMAILAIGLTALAAAAPLALEGGLVHPIDPLHPVDALGPSHSVLLSIVLAGLGMNAVRQLIGVNADLHATRAELADLAVAYTICWRAHCRSLPSRPSWRAVSARRAIPPQRPSSRMSKGLRVRRYAMSVRLWLVRICQASRPSSQLPTERFVPRASESPSSGTAPTLIRHMRARLRGRFARPRRTWSSTAARRRVGSCFGALRVRRRWRSRTTVGVHPTVPWELV